jgi:hypothetical protein
VIYVYPFLISLIGLALLAVNAGGQKPRGTGLDLGVVFLAILLVYGFVPGVGLLLAHQGVGQIMDQRLSSGFDVAQVEDVQWMHLLLVAGFVVGYFVGPKKAVTKLAEGFTLNAQSLVKPLVALAIVVSLLPVFMVRIWGADVGSEYISSYTVLRNAPLLVQQAYGILHQLHFSVLVAVLVVLIAARPQRHLLVALALGINMLYVSFSGGSRTVAFLLFLSYLVAGSMFVPNFNWRRIFLFAFPAILLFMIAGMFRNKAVDAGLLSLFQTGEFTSLFINAVDLKERLAAGWGEEVRFAFYLVDVLRLIPSQLLGGVKLDPAQWYAEAFYPEYFDAGGGFAFGILAECAAGFGRPEAALRGLILGWIFRFFRNRLMGSNASVAKIFVYVWMITVCYQSYRDTTFSMAVRALYQVVPVLLAMGVFHRLFDRRGKRKVPRMESQG